MSQAEVTARMNFRLSPEIKKAIEDAAAHCGQSLSDFAVSTLAQAARQILHEQQVTRLSARDHQRFLALLDDENAAPNKALVAAAKRYKKQVRNG
jgi:uncharacterized protein (DUF1778 family)